MCCTLPFLTLLLSKIVFILHNPILTHILPEGFSTPPHTPPRLTDLPPLYSCGPYVQDHTIWSLIILLLLHESLVFLAAFSLSNLQYCLPKRCKIITCWLIKNTCCTATDLWGEGKPSLSCWHNALETSQHCHCLWQALVFSNNQQNASLPPLLTYFVGKMQNLHFSTNQISLYAQSECSVCV